MLGSLRVRLLLALVLLPMLVAVAVTVLAIRQFRADKERYVHDLSAQTVELVARNVTARLEGLGLRASLMAWSDRDATAASAATAALQVAGDPRLSRVARSEPPRHGAYEVANVSSGTDLRLRITARARAGAGASSAGGGVTFEVHPTAVLDLRGYQGPTALFVVNRRGELLIHPDDAQLRQRRDLSDLVRSLGVFGDAAARIGTREVSVDEQPTLVAYARVAPDLAVLQSIGRQRVFAAAAPLVRSAIVTSAVVVVVAVLVGLLLAATVIRPLRSMAQQAEAIARGEYGVAVQTSSGGEIGDLAQQLNDMSAALKQRDQEVALMQRSVLRAERVNTAGRIIAAIAKELNRPLDTCFTLASECQRLGPADEKLRDNHVRIAQEANRAANILQNLSRVQTADEPASAPARSTAAGVVRPAPRPLELDMLVSDALVSSGALLRQRQLQVTADLDATATVVARPDELRNLLLDLLLFVAEQAETSRPVRVSLHQETPGEVAIDLEFHGTSWSEAQRQQLVNPYGSAAHGEGSLLLAVSAVVLEEQGGRLEVDEIDGRNRIRTILPLAADSGEVLTG